jgi:hypothetical protein
MKSGLTLVQLAQEIERRANAKKDIVANTSKTTFAATGDEKNANFRLQAGGLDFGVNDIAHSQVATHTEIPKAYYDKMRSAAPALLSDNVNCWFQKYPSPRMIRTLDGNARAFLSDKYRPLENEDLAEAVIPPLMELGLDVMSSQITDRKLYIKCVHPKVTRELKALGGKFGDGQHNIVRCLAPAITISNSEVGEGALSILGGVYDRFCSNLASFGERSTRKYHVGGKHELGGEDAYAMLSDQTRRITDAALWAQVGDIVRGAFNEANFAALCDKIAETATHKIEGDVVKVVELASKRFRLNEAEGSSVLRQLIEGADLSRFGLYNAITRASQDITDYDRATELERMGAQVIELPAGEWKQLAAAA